MLVMPGSAVPPHMLADPPPQQAVLGERHSVYLRTSLDLAPSADALWANTVAPTTADWEADVREQLRGEWLSIDASIAASQAQKRTVLSQAPSVSAAKHKLLISLSWALAATVREQATQQLAELESRMADKLFATVLNAAVQHNDALASCMKLPAKSPMVACQAMRLVNRTTSSKRAWLKQQVAAYIAKLHATMEETKQELLCSLSVCRSRDGIMAQ